MPLNLYENVALSAYTTLGVGGPARWMAQIASEDDICEAVEIARSRGVPIFILGGGSNLLVASSGFKGLVLHMAIPGLRNEAEGNFLRISAAAGESWDQLVNHSVTRNAAGIECLAGIPGTVGASPVQNIGAYGQEVAESIDSVRAYDLETSRFVEISKVQCGFSYRTSLFNSSAKGRYIVSRVNYTLKIGGKPKLEYADLKKAFQNSPEPALEKVAATVREIRHSKGMLLVDGDPDASSAGSFFKNPIVSEGVYEKIRESTGTEPPKYPAPTGYKLAAAWLVQHAGFEKGFALGRAGISTKHTLAIVNRGNATADEILALKDRIVDRVQDTFGVTLEQEPVMLG